MLRLVYSCFTFSVRLEFWEKCMLLLVKCYKINVVFHYHSIPSQWEDNMLSNMLKIFQLYIIHTMLNHEKAIMVNWCAYYCEWYSGGLYLTGQWYDKEKNNNCRCIYLCHYWALIGWYPHLNYLVWLPDFPHRKSRQAVYYQIARVFIWWHIQASQIFPKQE